MNRRLIATLAATASVLLGLCGPAHALGVNVQAPGTSVSIQPGSGISVTAPGTQVNIGQGSASVTIDPNQALSGQPPAGSPNPPPSGSPPAAERGASAPQSSSGPSGDKGSSSSPTVRAQPAPSGGNRTGRAARSSAGSGEPSRGATGASSSRARANAARSSATTTPVRSAAMEPRKTSALARVIERVPTELLVALVLTALIAAAMSLVWLRERSRVRAAQRKALVDPLTGISNRLAFEQRLGHEWKRSRRYARPLGVLMLDLDGLKQVNDTKGHDAGDAMIRSAADLIAGDIRQSDLAARLAGDEFVVLCPESGAGGLQQLAGKLQSRLRLAGIDASVGWAELTESDVRPEDMVARADASMYREKEMRSAARRSLIASRGLATAG